MLQYRISVTSTTGSIQHLSASWQAPANTASMIVRLINNVTGGSARFDTIQLTTWEDPVIPYGADLYYPDHLTSKTGTLETTGVLWREGTSTPYFLSYSGGTKPTPTSGYIVCTWYATLSAKCKGYLSQPVKAYGETPYTYLNGKFCPGSVSQLCRDTNFLSNNYARYFTASLKTYYFQQGKLKACTYTQCAISVRGDTWTNWPSASVAITNAPWHVPLWIYVTYTYKATDGATRVYSGLWELRAGYG